MSPLHFSDLLPPFSFSLNRSWSIYKETHVLKEFCALGMFEFPSMVSWRRQWHPTPELLPGKSHGWRSLGGCSPWGRWGSDTAERLHFYFSLSCIGEGNGNPLQCSCLENPRDGGAWWASVSGVAQSQTRLKRRSSSSSRHTLIFLPAHRSFKNRTADISVCEWKVLSHPRNVVFPRIFTIY